MIRYRVNTEQEFLEEFGEQWRHERRTTVCSFVKQMDFLFGCEITLSACDIFILEDDWFFILHKPKGTFQKFDLYKSDYFIKSGIWCLSMCMLKEISPEYNQKKILVYD